MAGGRRHAAFHAEAPAGNEQDIVGGDIGLQNLHRVQIQETEGNRRKLKTIHEHRNRLRVIINWLKQEYPEYAEAGGVVQISQEMLDNPNFCQHNNTEDLAYAGINVALIKAFLGSVKRKANGKICSYEHIRKFHDAILFGAEQAEEILPRLYHQSIHSFIDSFKKESVKAKREGNVDEINADPIPFDLYRHICQWSLEIGNTFLWVFTVLQWNCMARSASIDALGLHNLSNGADSFKITYDDSKTDGSGERVSPKNLYANPFDPSICPATALGIWLMGQNEKFRTQNRDSLFLENGSSKSASHRYCTQLVELIKDHRDAVIQYCRPERAKSHGIRKGAATHSTSGSTVPPPLPSVARRGEWSQGTVFDVYFLFAEPGDQYLGRCLAGLSPTSEKFAVLPPHFTHGVAHDDVYDGMQLCFGNIITLFSDAGGGGLVGVLYFLLASVVFHMDSFVKPMIESNPRHPFGTIPLLLYPDLMNRLKLIVTTDESETLSHASGVPPHIDHAKKLNRVVGKLATLTETMLEQTSEIKLSVLQAIEDRDVRAGVLTIDFLQNQLQEHHQEFKEMMKEQMDLMIGMMAGNGGGQDARPLLQPPPAQDRDGGVRYPIYCYNSRYWFVPKGWDFPERTFRRAGWSLWLLGQPGVVRPFRLLEGRSLSPDKKVRDRLKLEWRPIFQMMEKAPGMIIPRAAVEISAEFVDQTFALGTQYLQTRVGYVWEKSTRCEFLTVGSWSKHVQRSSIEKNGNDIDRGNLPPLGPLNRPHNIRRQRRQRLSNQDREERRNQRRRLGEYRAHHNNN